MNITLLDSASHITFLAPATTASSKRERGILPLFYCLLGVAFGGLFTASVLSFGHLLDLPVPCGKSHGCVSVASHFSSKLLGVPIAYFGAAAYLLIIFLLGRAPTARWARRGSFALSASGTAISAWLLLYAFFVIQATCWWCVASGVAMTLLFIGTGLMLRAPQSLAPVRPAWMLGLGMLSAVGIGLQAGFMQRAASAPPVSAGLLAKMDAQQFIDPAKSLGPADAPVTIVMFGDLWCPACRAAHTSLFKYYQANPTSVRLIYRHMPLWEIRGHEMSGAAAALSEIAAEEGQFWPFLHTIYERNHRLTREQYMQLMESLGINSDSSEQRIADDADPSVLRVHRDRQLADDLGINATPTFIVLLKDYPPISANQKTLPKILNSPQALTLLAERHALAQSP